ncbi:DUF916 and DUF3324 domain-containing protein [Bacillus sp. FSL K6-0067]|uniref:DUF916 and DUF3324 domain-containing protein n=1 Tax=Bacillus sp. FSL K6-0067 TaxID=2921412 RepID=UPI00077A3BDD|nr:DUF916 and DUF3324 domain-containing protein [Bacillus cereus]KXY06117.1 hypothetical protein AT267_09810 [Bacillus cereus]
MKYAKKIVAILLLTVFIIGLGEVYQSKALAAELNFAVKPIIPENQRDKKKTYFDLRVKPGQQQTLKIVLTNDTEQAVTIEPKVNVAVTNVNGIADYSMEVKEHDKTLKLPITDVVKAPNEITVPAKGQIELPIEVKMPEEEFDGILLGGISLQEKEKKDNKSQQKKNVSIENRYSYVVGFVLNENDNEVEPHLTLNTVAPGQMTARNVINANIQNTKPMLVNQLSIDAKISRKGSSEVLYHSEKKGMQMAPNSNFNYPIQLEGQPLEAGEYRATITAESKGKTWTWTKDFVIKADTAKKYNKSDVSIKKDYTWYYVLGGILFILIAIFFYFLGRRKSKKEEQK